MHTSTPNNYLKTMRQTVSTKQFLEPQKTLKTAKKIINRITIIIIFTSIKIKVFFRFISVSLTLVYSFLRFSISNYIISAATLDLSTKHFD